MSNFNMEEEEDFASKLVREFTPKPVAPTPVSTLPPPPPPPPPAEQDFLKEYLTASDNRTDVNKARTDASDKKLNISLFDAVTSSFGASKGKDGGFYDNLRKDQDQKVANAEGDWKGKLEGISKQANLSKMGQEAKDFDSNKTSGSPAANSLRLMLQSKGAKKQHLDGMSYEQMKDIFDQGSKSSGGRNDWVLTYETGPSGNPEALRINTATGQVSPVSYPDGKRVQRGFANRLFKSSLTGAQTMASSDMTNPTQIVLDAPGTIDETKEVTPFIIRENLNANQRESVDGVQKEYDKATSALTSRKEAAINVRTLVESSRKGLPMDREGFANILARLNGEVGAMSESDKAPFKGAAGWQAFTQRVIPFLQGKGQISDEDLAFIDTVAGALETSADKNLATYTQQATANIEKYTGLKPEYASKLVTTKQYAQATDPATEAKIAKVMNSETNKANGVTREAVIKSMQAKDLLPKEYK